MKKILKIPLNFFRIIYFLLALIITSIIVIYFGLPMLGPGLPGSDSGNFVTLAEWLYRWFPSIPFWYPQQGAGVSFTTYYPILSHLIVVIIAKLFSISVLIAFRYYAVLTVGLTCLGIYFLAVRFTKSQTVGALSAIFYALSPIAWTLMLTWGFFAEQASYQFVAPAIIFFELYLYGSYKGRKGLSQRLFILLFLFFSVLSLLAHPLAFVGLSSVLVPFSVIYPLAFKEKSKKLILKSIKKGILLFILVIILSLFFLVPFFRYQKMVSLGAATGKVAYSRGLMLENSIYFKTFFNIDPTPVLYKGLYDKIQNRSAFGWHNVSFPIAVSFFALIGFIGSFFLNRRLFALAIANLFSLVIALTPELLFFFFRTPVANYFGNWRAMIISSRLVIPVLAGFGCYAIGYFLAFPLRYLSLKLKWKALKLSAGSLFILFSTIITITAGAFALFYFRLWPNNPNYLLSYGPEAYYTQYKVDLRNIWGNEIDYCKDYAGASKERTPVFCSNKDIKETFWYKKLDKACKSIKKEKITPGNEVGNLCSGNINRTEIDKILDNCRKGPLSSDLSYVCPARVKTLDEQISSEDLISKLKIGDLGRRLITGDEGKLLGELPNNSNTRVDVSPGIGTVLMALPYYSNMPELGVYYNQSSLIPLMWNYEITAMYSQTGIWGQPQIVDELSKYFGLGYTFLSETNIPLKKYEKNWKKVDGNNKIFGILGLWEYKYPTGLLTATTKPVILVIGSRKEEAYFRIFHLANIGGISYDEAILVDGGENADAFNPEELKKFDAVILDGYRYKNQRTAWRNLSQYIQEGGSVLINTGWQYTSADWQNDKLPEFFPFSTLQWGSPGNSPAFDFGDRNLTKGLKPSDISPLIYNKTSWNISSNDKSNLRSWARDIVSVQNKVLVAAGNYGQGKVVWTGLDLPGHIGAYKDNPSEIKLFNNLIEYLLQGKPNHEIKASFSRDYPDQVEFTLNESSDKKTALYWREAYCPDFKAKLIKNEKQKSIPVYKAGPGLTMFILPNATAGSKIIYEYKTPLVITFSQIISLFTLIGVFLFVINPAVLLKIKNIIYTKVEKTEFKKKISKSYSDEDLDY